MEVGLGELVTSGADDPCAILTTAKLTVYVKHGKPTMLLAVCYPALGRDKETYGVCRSMCMAVRDRPTLEEG